MEQTHQLLTRILSLPSEAYDPDDIYWRMGITPPNQLLLSLAPGALVQKAMIHMQ